MGKIARTWSLMSASWQVLRMEKSLIMLPFISGICCLLLLASFAIPVCVTGAWHPPGHDAQTLGQVVYYGTLFVFYFANYFIIVFFNAAIVACAAARMGGGNPTIADGLRAAASRLPAIAGWALVLATVGLILRIIEDRSDKIVRVIAGLLGMAWTVMSFLVVPILVIENKNPIAAMQESTALLKRTWGKQVIGNFSFSGIFGLLSLPAIGLVILGFILENGVALIACCGLAIVYLILLTLIHTTLQAIFQTALYLYARDGIAPAGFDADVLGTALR